MRHKIILTIITVSSFILISTSSIFACTYEATITEGHLDFAITSDLDKLSIIQYIRVSGSALVTKMYSPDMEQPWTYFDDPNCNVSLTTPIGCKQNRQKQPKTLGDGAFWQWYSNNIYYPMPGGIYGLDFDSPPTYDSFKIGYGTSQPNQQWIFCNRMVATPTPTPTPSSAPTTTPTPTETPTSTPTPTIIPTQVPTPTPTPTPTSIPVKKIIFIPGMGASWNVDALINCKGSNYGGDWTLAPYAKEIYQELLNQLTIHNWDITQFYYDWRKDIRNNSIILTDLINSKTSVGEKVNIVGHSMGGLIGRNYLENQNGGKTSKFLAIGAPNAGSALIYPAIANGEFWINDLTEKIAATLFLNRCGIPPSFQNLLPTYDYLRDPSTKDLKDVSKMKIKNNLLPTDFVPPFWGVKVGTLAGTGYQTLKIINVIKNSKWVDGKPVKKESVNEGDGTVLIQSAQIPGAYSNDIINQSHSGIVASTEGVNKILEFLGSPGITDPPYSDSTSALILVGYPGNFWVTDKNGVTTQSDNGMVAIMNPKDGDYQLQMVPTSDTTDFIIGQFLSNGQTKYKEYEFKGLKQKPRIISFDSKHPKEEILHEAKEYKTYNFDKLWSNLWNFWNRFHK